MNKRKNIVNIHNKGVAMISVMIAIMFLAIISTAMLYISSSNYAMKSANANAKENFYQTDGELVRVSAGVRNAIMSSSDPKSEVDNYKSVSAGKYNCKALLGAALGVDSSMVPGSEDDAHYTDADGDTIHVKSASCNLTVQTKTDDASILEGVTRYTFDDVTITQVHSVGTNEFYNSVKTDIVFDVYETSVPSGGAGGVGNMSMLLDSNIEVSASKFPSLTMTGNSFITDYGATTGGYTQPGTKGLEINSESRINFVGEYNVVYGDMVLSGDSSVCVYGDLTVFGDIKIDGNATLIVAGNGKIYMCDTALPGRGTVSSISFSGGATAAKNLFPSDLESTKLVRVGNDKFEEFCTLINLNDSDPDNDGLMKKILKKTYIDGGNKYVVDCTSNINGMPAPTNAIAGTSQPTGILTANEFYGRKIGFCMLQQSYGSALNGGINNYLFISCKDSIIKMNENNPNTTIISKYTVGCGDTEHGVILSKLGTDEFNYVTASKGDAESAAYNNTDNPFNNVTIQFSSGDWTGKVGDFFQQDCNAYVDELFNVSSGGGGGGAKKYASACYFKSYSRDTVDN